ncbi:MAG: hypothetical protein ACE5EZ_05995 [Thermodesulfobacteriota bacterium]
MTAKSVRPTKKGFYSLASDVRGGIAWQGELLRDFWMWNRQYTEYSGGVRLIQTVRVTDLKEAALRYWRDKWVPLKPLTEELLRRMEDSLRAHQGLRDAGITFPSSAFLDPAEAIPEGLMGAEVRKHLGLEEVKAKKLVQKGRLNKKVIQAFKKSKGMVNGDVVL